MARVLETKREDQRPAPSAPQDQDLEAARKQILASGIPESRLAELETDAIFTLLEDVKAARDNFKRIGEPRVANAIRSIEIIQTLADRTRYCYRDDDIDTLEKSILDALAETVDMFRRGKGRAAHFRFPNGGNQPQPEAVN